MLQEVIVSLRHYISIRSIGEYSIGALSLIYLISHSIQKKTSMIDKLHQGLEIAYMILTLIANPVAIYMKWISIYSRIFHAPLTADLLLPWAYFEVAYMNVSVSRLLTIGQRTERSTSAI